MFLVFLETGHDRDSIRARNWMGRQVQVDIHGPGS